MASAPSANDLTRQQLDELDELLQRMLALPLSTSEISASPTISLPPLPGPVAPTTWRLDPPAVVPAVAPHLLQVPVIQEVERPRPAAQLPPERTASPEPPPRSVTPLVTKVTPPLVTNVAPTLANNVALTPSVPNNFAPPSIPTNIAPPMQAANPSPRSVAPPAQQSPLPEPTEVFANPIVASRASQLPQAQEEVFEEMALPFASELPPLPPPPLPIVLEPFVILNRVFDAICGLFGLPGRIMRSGFGKNLAGLVGIALMLYTAGHVAAIKAWVSLPFNLPWPR